jgi:Flp pilus assembly protein TadD
MLGFALWSSLLLAAVIRAPAQQVASPVQPKPADFGITCTLRDALGHPVSGLTIEIRSTAPPLERASAVTPSDGSVSFHGLTAGAYDLTVAGGILLPSRRVNINRSYATLVLKLPITLPQSSGHQDDTISVEQLSVPEKARETLRKAYEAWERNDTAQSRTLAIRALQLHPYYGPALSLLGILELNDGHPADAIIGLQQAVQYDPDSPRTYLALASACNELHNNTEALHALSIMAKFLPDSWQLHYETGRAYLGQGRFDAALNEFNRAQLLVQPERAVLHMAKAHALLGLRNYPAARAELEIVIRESSGSPYATESRKLVVLLDSRIKKDAPGITVPATSATTRGSTQPPLEH